MVSMPQYHIAVERTDDNRYIASNPSGAQLMHHAAGIMELWPKRTRVNLITRPRSTVAVGTALPGWTPVGRPPAHIPACPIKAPGSYLGCRTST